MKHPRIRNRAHRSKALFTVAALTLACAAPQTDGQDAAPDAGAPAPVGCGLSTAWAGDEECLLDNGAQLHFGPSDYDDPIATARFLAKPGSDATYTVDVPRTAMRFVAGYTARTRPGDHHLSLLVRTTGAPDYTYRPYTTSLPGTVFTTVKHDGSHVSYSYPPEYDRAAIEVPDELVSWVFDVHYINTTDKAELMEGWVNLDAVDEPPVVLAYFQFSGANAMNVPPRTRSVLRTGGAMCAPPQDVTIATLGGHEHSHGKRVSVFLGTKLVYTNLDWEHPFRAEFNSLTQNPAPTLTTAGATSGILGVPKGTPVSWECEIDNTLPTAIRYGSNLVTAEMCALFGYYTPPLPNHASWGCSPP